MFKGLSAIPQIGNFFTDAIKSHKVMERVETGLMLITKIKIDF